jgi:hypothetical protein
MGAGEVLGDAPLRRPGPGREELSSPDGYQQTIRGVLAHLRLADYQGPIPAPQTRRQSNDLNEAWVAAYLADRTSRQED